MNYISLDYSDLTRILNHIDDVWNMLLSIKCILQYLAIMWTINFILERIDDIKNIGKK